VSLSADGETITVFKSKRRGRRGAEAVTTTEFDASAVTSVSVNAGRGNDDVVLRALGDVDFVIPATILGGDGDDWIAAGAGVDSVDGGLGDDQVSAGAGNDVVNGGDDDDDVLYAADDVLDGGAGSAGADEDDQDRATVDDGEAALNAAVAEVGDRPGRGGGHGHGHGPRGGGGFSSRRIR
jgi:Ca2+-binding RTX toxin-like protein